MKWLLSLLIMMLFARPLQEGECPSFFDVNQCLIFKDTNAVRKNSGLAILKPSITCTNLAQAHALDMYQSGKLFHTSPKYGTFSQRLKSFHVAGNWHGENVFWSSQGVKFTPKVVNGWMQSPGHKANILHAKARAIGIGVNHGYFSQCFSDEK